MIPAVPRGRRRWVALGVAVLVALAVGGTLLWLLPAAPSTVPAATASSSTATTPTTAAPTSPPPPSPEPTTTAPPTTTASPTPPPAVVTTPEPTVEATVAAPAAPADPGVEGEVLSLVNGERAAAGCAPVVADDQLAAVARAHSADMRDRGYFSHTSPEGLSPFDRAAAAGVAGARAENIAMGQPDAASVMAAWMASPGHRANILDCSLTRLGVGVAEGTGGPWWTQLFGA